MGATGSGKTTLSALIPRLADVTGGRVLLDGVDVRDLALADLRTIVATAFEDPVLFSASVRENVALGTPEATDDDVRRALRVAHAEEFVDALPWGLDTRVGEQGLTLSGGQRQRLALARAVIGNPAVLVLDDPLSALDVHTEVEVEAALRRVLREVTALVVAHRPSTVQLADRVALLADGRIDRRGHPLRAARRGGRVPPAAVHPRGSGGGPMTQAWRGVAAEDLDTIDPATGLRLAARSRRLLGSLLRPRLRRVSAALALLVVDQVALLAGPLLIAVAIDRGIPAALHGRPGPLAWCIAGYAVAGEADALTVGAFCGCPGGSGRRAAGSSRAGVRADPAPVAGLPRALHIGPGDLPADQ